MMTTPRLRALPSTLVLAAACGGAGDPTGASLGSSLPGGSPPSGAYVGCTGVLSGTFDDNVIVPVGATCTLTDATVRANVKALENARLFVIESHVTGNVEGDKASVVHVTGGTVEGNIQIKDGTSPGEVGALVAGTLVPEGDIQIEKMRTGEILVEGARVLKGNLQVVENEVGAPLHLVTNEVAGNLQVFKNRGMGDKLVRDNTVSQDLQCKENSSPFVGGPNTAGETEDQCF
jgi:hypothetical protein